MKIVIIIFFIIFVILYIAGFIYDIIYSFRKKKSNEKEIMIDFTEIIKKVELRKKRRKCRYYKNYINKK